MERPACLYLIIYPANVSEREGEDFDELSRVAPFGFADGGGDASHY